ncbi:uncharacterized protein [Nicotiana sylvestris]|uniref:uncharacterized protein n=1 Tax=Nicotiana sylvestris TaxID=4096 RepID=UPI00388C88DD
MHFLFIIHYYLYTFPFYSVIITFLDEPVTVTCNEATQYENSGLDEKDEIPEEIVREVENFENKPKSNLDETKAVNLGDVETIKDTRINIHLSPIENEEYICFLKDYEDMFAWSYDDMTGLSTSIVAHKLPTNTMCQPVKQKLRKFKPDMSMKIKEENAGATYMRDMTTIFHGMIHEEIEVYVDDVIIKSKKAADHIADLRKFFDRLRSRFIAQSTVICEPIFMMLGKNAETSWTEDCQKAFDKIKEILSTPPVLVPPEPERPLLLYLSVLDGAFRCVLKPMPTGKLAKWQILLSEFDIVYATKKMVKGKELADHPAENPVGEAYELLKMYFPDEEVSFVGDDITEAYDGWRMFFDKAANFKGGGIGVVLLAYCAHVEEEADGKPWFHDINAYLSKGEYLKHANHTQKCTLRRLSNLFFHSGGNLYKRTPDMGLLRCADAKEASKLLENVHAGSCGPHMNGFVLAKKILRVEAVSYKAITKKVIADFVKDRIVFRFGVHESIIIDNASNLNSDLMKAMCEAFKIKHKNSTAYRPQMNGAIEAANKNIKKILRKMAENHR